MDKLYTEYENCRTDKQDYEEMVDRLSKEMEDRVEGLKQEHRETLKSKEAQIRDLYTKVVMTADYLYCIIAAFVVCLVQRKFFFNVHMCMLRL